MQSEGAGAWPSIVSCVPSLSLKLSYMKLSTRRSLKLPEYKDTASPARLNTSRPAASPPKLSPKT